LRIIKQRGRTTALVLHPEDAAMSFVACAPIAAVRPDADLPLQKIERLAASFGSRCLTLPPDFHHRCAVQEAT
jgi:hypothetical protein